MNPSKAEIDEFFSVVDNQDKDHIDFLEFMLLMTWQKQKSAAELEEDMQDTFSIFDRNDD